MRPGASTRPSRITAWMFEPCWEDGLVMRFPGRRGRRPGTGLDPGLCTCGTLARGTRTLLLSLRSPQPTRLLEVALESPVEGPLVPVNAGQCLADRVPGAPHKLVGVVHVVPARTRSSKSLRKTDRSLSFQRRSRSRSTQTSCAAGSTLGCWAACTSPESTEPLVATSAQITTEQTVDASQISGLVTTFRLFMLGSTASRAGINEPDERVSSLEQAWLRRD